jgi:hypothetical protein
MTTPWTEVADPSSEFAVGAPLKSEHGLIWYKNPIAIAEGADGAPRSSTRSIHPGGSELDGVLTNATSISTAGIYDLTSFTRSSALSLPFATVLRVNGNLSLSSTITVATHTAGDALFGQMLGCVSGGNGVGDGGGGSASQGGAGSGTAGAGLQSTFAGGRHLWAFLRMLLGGVSGAGTNGGGGLLLIVHGNADFTGGTINANGSDGAGNGGGGAGSITVIATGTITGGTFNAKGGTATGSAGPGGGGLIQLVASAFSGTQTTSVIAGTGGAGGAQPGLATSSTLTDAQINALVTR